MGHRWLSEAGPDSRLVDVARLALAERVPPVNYYLPLAACHAEADTEYVHQLRVSTRRAETALRLYRDLLPGALRRTARRRLKQIRRAAGPARELDVILSRLHPMATECPLTADQEEGLRRVWMAERAAAQERLVALHEQLVARRFLLPLQLILAYVRWPGGGKSPRWGESTSSLLRSHVQRLVERSRKLENIDQLHRFRIACKQLRYALELSSPALTDELRNRLYPAAKNLQEHLGRLNDHVSALGLLRKLRSAPLPDVTEATLERLLAAEHAAAQQLTAQFQAWWVSDEGQAVRLELIDVVTD